MERATPVPTSVLCVDVKRAAELLGGVSEYTVRAWIANGDLPAVKFPDVRRRGEPNRRVLIAVSDIEAFVARHREVAR
jgi:hypothetical protein